MGKIDYNGHSYDTVVKSTDQLVIEVHFDSHGATEFTRDGHKWSVTNGEDYLPKDYSIDEIGKILESQQ